MKKVFLSVALLAVFAVSAVETSLFKYAPDSTVAVVQADVTRLLQHPDVVKTLNEPENLKTRQEFEKKTGIRVEDFRKILLFISASGEAVVLIGVDEKLDVEQLFVKNGVKFQKVPAKGKTVFRLAEAGRRGKKVEVLKMAPGVILCGEEGDMVSYLDQPRGKAAQVTAVAAQIPADPPLWLAFANVFKNPQGKIDDPRQLYLTFQFAGKKMNDLDFKLKLFCGDKEGAQILAGTIPMYLNMGIALVVNDQALGKELLSSVKIDTADKDVLVNAYISEQLSQKMSVYFKNNADRLLKQGVAQTGAEGGEEAEGTDKKAPAAKSAPAAKPVPADKTK